MAFPVVGIITGAFQLIGNAIKNWQERKKMEQQVKLEIQKAKAEGIIKLAQTAQQADIKWDQIMAEGSQSSWKDEWFVLLLSVPAILCFIPGMDIYVKKGFEALQLTPDWYKAAFGLAVAASFGYRKFANYMMNRKK
ncbi:MAG: hypothetical protein JRJ29_00290 [Deltaproteobacteria bacterium]|nr:hypothetical protein [Deltaproteobacteria bacterium]MBW2081603.1 hypothetical protein [Deltaproteobacteria bacterium]